MLAGGSTNTGQLLIGAATNLGRNHIQSSLMNEHVLNCSKKSQTHDDSPPLDLIREQKKASRPLLLRDRTPPSPATTKIQPPAAVVESLTKEMIRRQSCLLFCASLQHHSAPCTSPLHIHVLHLTQCNPLPPDGDATSLILATLRLRSNLRNLLRILLVHARSSLQQALLHGAAGLSMRHSRCQRGAARDATSAMLTVGRAGAGVLLREVWDGVWGGVLASEATDQCVVGLAGFGEGVVARVEVFALFELVLQQVFLVRELAVEAEELLFFFGEGLRESDVSWLVWV